jgi:hypothetical protein
MFRALTCPSSGGKIVFNTASGIFALCKRLYSTQVESCVPDAVLNTIFPPEDGHVNARNMLRIIV